MKVDPVFVLSPLPQPPSMPTRRAFLLMSGAFAAGAAVGGACVYSAGVAAGSAGPGSGAPAGGAAPVPAEAELPKSGDVELDELRRLAVKAPLDELFAKGMMFLSHRVKSYQTDAILWQGVDRMSKEIIENPTRRVDQIMIASVIGQIDGEARPSSPSLRERVPQLRIRREEERRR